MYQYDNASPSFSLWAQEDGPTSTMNMTMVDRCGVLGRPGQQLAAARYMASSQQDALTHCTCHSLRAAAGVGVLQQWRNDGACRRAVLEGRGGPG